MRVYVLFFISLPHSRRQTGFPLWPGRIHRIFGFKANRRRAKTTETLRCQRTTQWRRRRRLILYNMYIIQVERCLLYSTALYHSASLAQTLYQYTFCSIYDVMMHNTLCYMLSAAIIQVQCIFSRPRARKMKNTFVDR